MAQPFLPSTPSSSYHGSQSDKLSLSRTRSSTSNGRVHKQSSHQQQRQLQQKQHRKKKKQQPSPPPKPPSSWEQLKSLLTCRIVGLTQVHDPSSAAAAGGTAKNGSKYAKLGSSCTSICTFKDVVHCNTRAIHHRGDHDAFPDSCSTASGTLGSEIGLLAARSSSRRKKPLRQRGLLRRHLVLQRYPTPRTICSCPECGDVFTKAESLEMHQAIRHAVSELGPEDSGRNIVEIIFKSSWLKKDQPLCKIERILKVHNTQRTITRFEDYRDSVKARAAAALLQLNAATARHGGGGRRTPGAPRTATSCSASTAVASTAASAHGFHQPLLFLVVVLSNALWPHHEPGKGVRTTASSGRAHDCCLRASGHEPDGGLGRRAMLVCRVIAGRVRPVGDEAAAAPTDETGSSSSAVFDSTATVQHGYSDGAAAGGACPSLEELFVSTPRAILPCFVVIYRVTA
ncbi:unnamed protein product [Spirodela intermedia]|uniref:C2H2-type domain-containing protein n=1 Tax=Spirodela intermedia TaxID=51605 RepID=A0A7I8IE96_SPIIN|nr:unnamed protein product [Spirodela intermedia]CAA6655951.1 unnamed protein product [Spirodela intermedia]